MLFEINVHRRNLLMPGAAKERGRYALDELLFEGGFVVATNGRALFRSELPYGEFVDESFHISAQECARVAKALTNSKQLKTLTMVVSLEDNN